MEHVLNAAVVVVPREDHRHEGHLGSHQEDLPAIHRNCGGTFQA